MLEESMQTRDDHINSLGARVSLFNIFNLPRLNFFKYQNHSF